MVEQNAGNDMYGLTEDEYEALTEKFGLSIFEKLILKFAFGRRRQRLLSRFDTRGKSVVIPLAEEDQKIGKTSGVQIDEREANLLAKAGRYMELQSQKNKPEFKPPEVTLFKGRGIKVNPRRE